MARFDLYTDRKYWWWYFYLSLAAAKGDERKKLEEMIYDAVSYEDNYEDRKERDRVKNKYHVTKNGPF